MKLVIFGLTISSSWGNGHATVWRSLCKALIGRGHRVVFFEKDVPYYEHHRDLHELPGGGLVLYPEWQNARATAQRHLADADVAMVTSFCPDGIAATDLIMESRVRLRVFYDLDTPVTLQRQADGEPLTWIGPRRLADFDLVLSFTGGKSLDLLKQRLSARRVAPLYGSVDPEVHRRVPPVDVFRADLSYLGTYAADRQAALEMLLVEPARRLPAQRFLIGGAQYPADFPWAANIYFVRHIAPPDHPAFYSSARITLNVTRAVMAEIGYCPSGRFFEAAACGTPILSDWWEGLDHFFEPGAEILIGRGTDEAVQALQLSDGELKRVALRARERTLSEHTGECRADDLEAVLDTALCAQITECARPRAQQFMSSQPVNHTDVAAPDDHVVVRQFVKT